MQRFRIPFVFPMPATLSTDFFEEYGGRILGSNTWVGGGARCPVDEGVLAMLEVPGLRMGHGAESNMRTRDAATRLGGRCSDQNGANFLRLTRYEPRRDRGRGRKNSVPGRRCAPGYARPISTKA